MPTLTLLRGLPGSGKTTRAREMVALGDAGSMIRLNRDDLRRSLIDPDYRMPVYAAEQRITAVQRQAARDALSAGVDVVVDDTNLRLKFAREWADLAAEVSAEFVVDDLCLAVSVDECIARDARRSGVARVGEEVIRSMHDRFLASGRLAVPTATEKSGPSVRPYEGTPGKPSAAIIDLDGTLALRREGKGARGWWPGPDGEDRCGEDIPNAPVVTTVRQLAIGRRGLLPIFMSGRTEACREQTTDWLMKHVGLAVPHLFMRAAGDTRSDDIVKAELFDRHVRDHFDVAFTIDDRVSVVAMWRRMGLTCFAVAEGDF